MKKLLSAFAAAVLICTTLAAFPLTTSAATEYAKYLASMEDLDKSKVSSDGAMLAGAVPYFYQWEMCKLPVRVEMQQKHKFDGANAMKISCSDSSIGGDEWHSTIGFTYGADTKYNNWTGAQFLEFWIKNDTGVNLGIQIQFTENNANNENFGEPWRIKVKTKVQYEENGKFIERESDVSDPTQYNAFSVESEGAIEVPKDYEGRIRVAINTNNFSRATWFSPKPGDGSNNKIDKGNIGNLIFSYDPRTVENGTAWYLDSVRLVAPNAAMKDSVPYADLEKTIGGPVTTTTTTKGKTGTKTDATTTTSEKTKATAGSGTEASQAESTSGADAAPVGLLPSSSEGSSPTGDKDVDGKPGGLSPGVIAAIVVGAILILGGGTGLVLYTQREKIFHKKPAGGSDGDTPDE